MWLLVAFWPPLLLGLGVALVLWDRVPPAVAWGVSGAVAILGIALLTRVRGRRGRSRR
jgi:hypothetical protein